MAKSIRIQNCGWEEVNIPGVPNFIRRAYDDFPIPIQELSEAQLRRIAKHWTEELVNKSKVKRMMETDNGNR